MNDNPQNLPDNSALKLTGVFLLAEFPHATKKLKFAPIQLYNAMVDWGNCADNLNDVCKKNNIRIESVYDLIETYGEIRNLYDIMRERKAKILANLPLAEYKNLPDEAYYIDKFGNRQLSQAYVTLLRDKCNNYHRIATYHETGTLVAQAKMETLNRHLNININANAEDLPELTDTLDALVRD